MMGVAVADPAVAVCHPDFIKRAVGHLQAAHPSALDLYNRLQAACACREQLLGVLSNAGKVLHEQPLQFSMPRHCSVLSHTLSMATCTLDLLGLSN